MKRKLSAPQSYITEYFTCTVSGKPASKTTHRVDTRSLYEFTLCIPEICATICYHIKWYNDEDMRSLLYTCKTLYNLIPYITKDIERLLNPKILGIETIQKVQTEHVFHLPSYWPSKTCVSPNDYNHVWCQHIYFLQTHDFTDIGRWGIEDQYDRLKNIPNLDLKRIKKLFFTCDTKEKIVQFLERMEVRLFSLKRYRQQLVNLRRSKEDDTLFL
jgi:hypothetical protein